MKRGALGRCASCQLKGRRWLCVLEFYLGRGAASAGAGGSGALVAGCREAASSLINCSPANLANLPSDQTSTDLKFKF